MRWKTWEEGKQRTLIEGSKIIMEGGGHEEEKN